MVRKVVRKVIRGKKNLKMIRTLIGKGLYMQQEVYEHFCYLFVYGIMLVLLDLTN